MAGLRLMEAQLLSLNLARPSLEEFFIGKLQERGMFETRTST